MPERCVLNPVRHGFHVTNENGASGVALWIRRRVAFIKEMGVRVPLVWRSLLAFALETNLRRWYLPRITVQQDDLPSLSYTLVLRLPTDYHRL